MGATLQDLVSCKRSNFFTSMVINRKKILHTKVVQGIFVLFRSIVQQRTLPCIWIITLPSFVWWHHIESLCVCAEICCISVLHAGWFCFVFVESDLQSECLRSCFWMPHVQNFTDKHISRNSSSGELSLDFICI